MASRSTGHSTLGDDIAGRSVKPSVPDWAWGSEATWCRGGTEPVCVPEAGRPNVPTRRTYVLESSRSMCDLYSNTSDQVAIRDPFPGSQYATGSRSDTILREVQSKWDCERDSPRRLQTLQNSTAQPAAGPGFQPSDSQHSPVAGYSRCPARNAAARDGSRRRRFMRHTATEPASN
jgi:hypothetical protein